MSSTYTEFSFYGEILQEEPLKDFEIEVKVSYQAIVDKKWGADADGNRGITMEYVDDIEFTVCNLQGDDITEHIRTNFPTDYKHLEERAIDLAKEFEGYDPDGDYDDDDEIWRYRNDGRDDF